MNKDTLEQRQAEMKSSLKKGKPCLRVPHRQNGKAKKKVKKIIPAETVRNISVAVSGEIKGDMTPEQVKTVKRHVIGITRILSDLGVLKPKCLKCFDELGWLSHCRCIKPLDID